MSRFRQVIVAGDCFVNAMLGGYANEPMSARIWREREQNPCRALLPFVDWVALNVFRDPDHCRSSYENVFRRAYLPNEYRQPTNP